jgi:hypothetical protein
VVPDNMELDNGFKVQWEAFLRHVALRGSVGGKTRPGSAAEPFPYDFLAGARGVQLAELGLRSSAEHRRVEVPELEL